MRAIVFAASKGGVGKTTLTAAVAVEACRSGHSVALFDFDQIKGLSRWFDLRERNLESSQPKLIDQCATIDEALKRARAVKIDWLMIDTPPAGLHRIQSAVAVADLVVIPSRPSPLDVMSMDAIFEICHQAGRPHLLVLNATTRNSEMSVGARNFLHSRAASLWTGEVSASELHPMAMISGSTAAELDRDKSASDEIAELWKAIEATVAARDRHYIPARKGDRR